jgi:adenylate cyclase
MNSSKAVSSIGFMRLTGNKARAEEQHRRGSGSRADRLHVAFAAEEAKGLRLSFRLRLLAIALVALFLLVVNTWPEVLYYDALMLGLIGVGALSLVPARGTDRAGPAEWTRWVVPLADLALVTFAVAYPNPLGGDRWLTLPLRLRLDNFLYPLLFIALATLTYSPRQVIWTGLCAALCWTLATLWIAHQPDVHFILGVGESWGSLSPTAQTATFIDANTVTAVALVKQVLLLLITAAILAAAVRRARSLALRQVRVEAERTQLARYFSPNLVDELANADRPVGAIRRSEIAVLFADIVGFTRLSEAIGPEETIALLREFHARMQATVFAHRGTLDKYLGDGLMATFGTPVPGPHDAADALGAAREMAAAIARWNDERRAAGGAPIEIGIGVHWGAVVLGDIGGENRLEFATIGDTVNVARRLEALTRALGGEIVASDDLVRAMRSAVASPEADALMAGFARGEAQQLRGRSAPVEIHVRPRAASAQRR